MSAPRHRRLWQRFFLDPSITQLTQGITADKIALTIALGVNLGLFPLLGISTLVCGVAAVVLRLNQPVMQIVGWAVLPLHLATLLFYYRAGEAMFGIPPIPLSIPLIIERFFAGVGPFLRDYGMTGVRGIIIWALLFPFLHFPLLWLLRPPLRRLAAGIRRSAERKGQAVPD